MSAEPAFFDTNILVYTRDTADPRKQAVAENLYSSHLADRTLYLSTQVLQEFFVTLSRKIAGVSVDEDATLTAHLAKLHDVTTTPADVLNAIDTQRRYALSFWDSLILVAARKSGAGVLYTEDLRHGQKFGSLHVENPFLTSPR